MASKIAEIGQLCGTISSSSQIKGVVHQGQTLSGSLDMPKILNYTYEAGNGIIIEDKVISLDELIIDCGSSTTVI